jgi:hypothetical protein
MIRQFSHACIPAKLTKQTSPVLFCCVRLAILTGHHIGIRESTEIVGTRASGKSIYCDKDS